MSKILNSHFQLGPISVCY